MISHRHRRIYGNVPTCASTSVLAWFTAHSEYLNDHGELRADALPSLLAGKRDVTGDKRIRTRHRGYALACASALNRMELGDPEALDEPLVKLFVESHAQAPREIWLDLDATDEMRALPVAFLPEVFQNCCLGCRAWDWRVFFHAAVGSSCRP